MVNLTLTPQTPPLPHAKRAPAWTLQDRSCTTLKRARACVKAGQNCPWTRARRSGRSVNEASVEPAILRLLGRQAWAGARSGPQRDQARRRPRAVGRHFRAVL